MAGYIVDVADDMELSYASIASLCCNASLLRDGYRPNTSAVADQTSTRCSFFSSDQFMRYFAYRHSTEGSKTLICLSCFQTLAVRVEAGDVEVESVQRQHVCRLYGNDLLENVLRLMARSRDQA